MNNFIEQFYLEDLSICDKLIQFYNDNPSLHRRGSIGPTSTNRIDPTKKDCFQISNSEIDPTIIDEYLSQLHPCIIEYLDLYEHAGKPKFKVSDIFNLQYYQPMQAYHSWHCENASIHNRLRYLVFMTYLNDVTDGGETEWFYQKIKLKPKKGLTVIWPAEWTHTHRGIASMTQDKYIVTGWLCLVDNIGHLNDI